MTLSRQRHPETGMARRRASRSLFALLVVTVALGVLLNIIAGHVTAFDFCRWQSYVGALVLFALVLSAVYAIMLWDDRNIGQDETRIELLLGYVESGGRTHAVVRPSYGVTGEAATAWQAVWGEKGLALPDQPGGQTPDIQDERLRLLRALLHLLATRAAAEHVRFEHHLPRAVQRRILWGPKRAASPRSGFPARIQAVHMELVRHLLMRYLAQFDEYGLPGQRIHGWLRLEIPMQKIPWQELHPIVRDNRFSITQEEIKEGVGTRKVDLRPRSLALPEGRTWRLLTRGSCSSA